MVPCFVFLKNSPVGLVYDLFLLSWGFFSNCNLYCGETYSMKNKMNAFLSKTF